MKICVLYWLQHVSYQRKEENHRVAPDTRKRYRIYRSADRFVDLGNKIFDRSPQNTPKRQSLPPWLVVYGRKTQKTFDLSHQDRSEKLRLDHQKARVEKVRSFAPSQGFQSTNIFLAEKFLLLAPSRSARLFNPCEGTLVHTNLHCS